MNIRNAKSLVKHILQADLSKRYGNLKGGVNDIKDHKFFKSFSWGDLLAKKMKPGYIPPLKYSVIERIISIEEWTIHDTSPSIPIPKPKVRQ